MKTLSYEGLEMYARDVTFYVQLFYDEACTEPASELQELRFENAASSTVTFGNLEVGKKYYVAECDAAGNVLQTGTLMDGTVYAPNFTSGNMVIREDGGTTTVELDNELFNWPSGFYTQGELTVNKLLLNADGSEKNSDEVFYAGIFSDASYTTLSDKVEYNILELNMAGGSVASAMTAVALDSVDASETLYVTEVDANGNPVSGAAGFQYEVTVDQTTVTLDPQHKAVAVTITNKEIPHGYYMGGELTVTKRLRGKDGNAKNSNEVFYAGIFADPGYTTLSDMVEYNVLELNLNGGSEASAMTLVALDNLGTDTTLYVTEVDADGNPVAGAAGFKYTVSVDQTKVSLNKNHEAAMVVITNSEADETPKTGDETPIASYAGMMVIAFAAMVMLIVAEERRRVNNKK